MPEETTPTLKDIFGCLSYKPGIQEDFVDLLKNEQYEEAIKILETVSFGASDLDLVYAGTLQARGYKALAQILLKATERAEENYEKMKDSYRTKEEELKEEWDLSDRRIKELEAKLKSSEEKLRETEGRLDSLLEEIGDLSSH